jgi:hypothetical protein
MGSTVLEDELTAITPGKESFREVLSTTMSPSTIKSGGMVWLHLRNAQAGISVGAILANFSSFPILRNHRFPTEGGHECKEEQRKQRK